MRLPSQGFKVILKVGRFPLSSWANAVVKGAEHSNVQPREAPIHTPMSYNLAAKSNPKHRGMSCVVQRDILHCISPRITRTPFRWHPAKRGSAVVWIKSLDALEYQVCSDEPGHTNTKCVPCLSAISTDTCSEFFVYMNSMVTTAVPWKRISPVSI